MTDLDLTATGKNSPYDTLARNHYRLEVDDQGAVLRLYEGDWRKNAFIRPDLATARERGIEFYTRLNMPKEDREKLERWFGIVERKT